VDIKTVLHDGGFYVGTGEKPVNPEYKINNKWEQVPGPQGFYREFFPGHGKGINEKQRSDQKKTGLPQYFQESRKNLVKRVPVNGKYIHQYKYCVGKAESGKNQVGAAVSFFVGKKKHRKQYV
jgi:hypothetical protein